MHICIPNPSGSKPKSPGRLRPKRNRSICMSSASKKKEHGIRALFFKKDYIYIYFHLPSSHSGGELPGNHNGLSGGNGSQTLETPFVAFTVRVLPCSDHVLVFDDVNFHGTSLFRNLQTKESESFCV